MVASSALPAPPIERYRFSVDEYDQLAALRILGEDDRVELIEGEIVVKSAITAPHAACVDRMARLLVLVLGVGTAR